MSTPAADMESRSPPLAEASPLLVVGNKRSGTSLLVNLLNLHPRILVAHEADIVWILYQMWSGRSMDELERHPSDEAKGMRATVDHCGALLRRLEGHTDDPRAIRQVFYGVLAHINARGRGGWDSPADKQNLRWVGDKKPAQHADPQLTSFINHHLPGGHFVHVVRDPRHVVASMREAAREWGRQSVPDPWYGSPDEVAGHWARHEERVLHLREESRGRVHTVRLEDLAHRPVASLATLFEQLGLEVPAGISTIVDEWVWDPNTRHEPADFEPTGAVARVMAEYGYL